MKFPWAYESYYWWGSEQGLCTSHEREISQPPHYSILGMKKDKGSDPMEGVANQVRVAQTNHLFSVLIYYTVSYLSLHTLDLSDVQISDYWKYLQAQELNYNGASVSKENLFLLHFPMDQMRSYIYSPENPYGVVFNTIIRLDQSFFNSVEWKRVFWVYEHHFDGNTLSLLLLLGSLFYAIFSNVFFSWLQGYSAQPPSYLWSRWEYSKEL